MDQLSTFYSNPNGTASQGDMKIGIDLMPSFSGHPSLPYIPKQNKNTPPWKQLQAPRSLSLSKTRPHQPTKNAYYNRCIENMFP